MKRTMVAKRHADDSEENDGSQVIMLVVKRSNGSDLVVKRSNGSEKKCLW